MDSSETQIIVPSVFDPAKLFEEKLERVLLSIQGIREEGFLRNPDVDKLIRDIQLIKEGL